MSCGLRHAHPLDLDLYGVSLAEVQQSSSGWQHLSDEFGICIAGGQGVHVGEDKVFGSVRAEGGFVVALDDGES